MMTRAYQTEVRGTIAIGDQDSDAINFKDYAQGIFAIPAAFTGASVSFKVSNEVAGTYSPVYDASDALVVVTVTAGRAYAFPIALFGAAFIKIRSASAEAAERIIDCGLKY